MKNHKIEDGAVVVTGAAGFIGSALVWALNQRGIEDIYVVDYLKSDERFKNLVPLSFNEYYEADFFLDMIGDAESGSDFFKDAGVKTVFHLGACSSTMEKDAKYLFENNVQYSQILASNCIPNDIRFVYASSAATYGDGSRGMDDKDPDIQNLRPLNMYGYSKHMLDLWLDKMGMAEHCVGLKYFNVYGPNEGHKGDMRSVVHKAFGQIQETGKIKLFKSYHPDYKDGCQMRDFLYVKDAVDMTLHLAESDTANGLYNLGSGVAHTWLDLAAAVFKAMGKPMDVEFIDMPEDLKKKYQYYTCADISKLRSTKFKKDITPLETAVADYVQNYLMTGIYLGD